MEISFGETLQLFVTGGAVATYAIYKIRSRKSNANSGKNERPGKAGPCVEHSKKLAVLENDIEDSHERFKEMMEANQREHQLIIRLIKNGGRD